MGNYLQMSTQQQIAALLELRWSHRRIARELDVHRETVGRYARLQESKPANPIAGAEELEGEGEPDQNRPNPIAGPPSAAAAHQQQIEKALEKGLSVDRQHSGHRSR